MSTRKRPRKSRSGPPQTAAEIRARGALPLRGVTLPADVAEMVRERLGPEPWARGALSAAVIEAVRAWVGE